MSGAAEVNPTKRSGVPTGRGLARLSLSAGGYRNIYVVVNTQRV